MRFPLRLSEFSLNYKKQICIRYRLDFNRCLVLVSKCRGASTYIVSSHYFLTYCPACTCGFSEGRGGKRHVIDLIAFISVSQQFKIFIEDKIAFVFLYCRRVWIS